MTVGEMLQYTNRLKEILNCECSDHIRDVRLANLMTDLEKVYGIPMSHYAEFETQNPFVMQLYRTVSDARTF